MKRSMHSRVTHCTKTEGYREKARIDVSVSPAVVVGRAGCFNGNPAGPARRGYPPHEGVFHQRVPQRITLVVGMPLPVVGMLAVLEAGDPVAGQERQHTKRSLVLLDERRIAISVEYLGKRCGLSEKVQSAFRKNTRHRYTCGVDPTERVEIALGNKR
jgi:hypothetical protein